MKKENYNPNIDEAIDRWLATQEESKGDDLFYDDITVPIYTVTKFGENGEILERELLGEVSAICHIDELKSNIKDDWKCLMWHADEFKEANGRYPEEGERISGKSHTALMRK